MDAEIFEILYLKQNIIENEYNIKRMNAVIAGLPYYNRIDNLSIIAYVFLPHARVL